jgi:O-antigen ligase
MIGIDITFGSPNSFGPSVAISLVWLQLAWRLRDTIAQSWPPTRQRLFAGGLLAYLGMALCAIILTKSRTGMVTAIFAVILLATNRKSASQKAKGLIWVPLFLVAIWIMMPEAHRARLSTVWDRNVNRTAAAMGDARTADFWLGVEIFKQHPLIGAGLDTTRTLRKAFNSDYDLVSHNLYGKLLGETGLLGTAAFALFLLGVIANRRATRRLAKQESADMDVYAATAQAAFYTILLLLFMGWAAGGLTQIQWVWAAALCQLCRWLAEEAAASDDLIPEDAVLGCDHCAELVT